MFYDVCCAIQVTQTSRYHAHVSRTAIIHGYGTEHFYILTTGRAHSSYPRCTLPNKIYAGQPYTHTANVLATNLIRLRSFSCAAALRSFSSDAPGLERTGLPAFAAVLYMRLILDAKKKKALPRF